MFSRIDGSHKGQILVICSPVIQNWYYDYIITFPLEKKIFGKDVYNVQVERGYTRMKYALLLVN